MADHDQAAEDRTEEPTQQRLDQAREKGQIPVSRDLDMLAGLGGAAMGATMFLPTASRDLAERSASFIGRLGTMEVGGAGFTGHLSAVLVSAAVILAAVALPAAACSIMSALLQTQFYVGGSPVKFQLSRISPASGLTRIFSKHNLLEFLKSTARLAVLGFLAWSVLVQGLHEAMGVLGSDVVRLLPVSRD